MAFAGNVYRRSTAQSLVLTVAYDPAQLCARLDAELAVNPREVRLDGLRADEQCGSNVFVGHARARQLSHSPLGRCQRLITARRDLGAGEFRPYPVRPQRCTHLFKSPQRLPEGGTGT